MIAEVCFDDLIPIPGHPNAIREARFLAEDGWEIRVEHGAVILSRHDVAPFAVCGYGYTYSLPVPAPAPTQPDKPAGKKRQQPPPSTAT